jgi:hypothetical protein
MVSKKTIKGYGFSTLFEYFEYILEGRVNGNISSCRELIMQLSKPQAIDFISWLAGEGKNADNKGDYEYLYNLTLQVLKS